jgi:hypothetical protein
MRERVLLSKGQRFTWSCRHIILRAQTQQDISTSRLSTSFIMDTFRQKGNGQTVRITLWRLYTLATSRSISTRGFLEAITLAISC